MSKAVGISPETRTAAYLKQTGKKELTPRQRRRAVKKNKRILAKEFGNS